MCDMDMELVDVGCDGCQSCHVEHDFHSSDERVFLVALNKKSLHP